VEAEGPILQHPISLFYTNYWLIRRQSRGILFQVNHRMPTETDIVSRIRKRALNTDRIVVGIGDDAAVLRLDSDSDLIACCDLMVEGIHFRLDWTPPALLGHKALAVTLSDIAAMGAIARYAMLSVAFPAGSSTDFIDDFLSGLFEIADRFGVSLVGGDTSSSPGPFFIDTSVIGDCAEGRAVTRSGARPGELIYVTGELGASALGLKLLGQGHRLEESASDEPGQARRQALLKQLMPEPRLKLGQALAEGGIATAMIDVSDGLSTDLSHLVEESGCGAVIYPDAIPVAGCARVLANNGLDLDPLALALHGGEEYELLFTSRAGNRERVSEIAASLGLPITAIGRTVAGEGLQLERGGVLLPLGPSGFQHLV
jgi:thiamine-monophosphate kinase